MKKKILIAAGILVVLLILAVVIIGMNLGKIIKNGVETVGPRITQTSVKLDSATLSPLGGSGTLKGFVLGNPEGYKTPSAIQAGKVSVGVQPKSLFSDKVRVTHVRVESPEITFEGTLGTANNLSKLLDNVKQSTGGSQPAPQPPTPQPPTSQPSGKSEGKKLQVDEFTITGAKVNLSMTLLGGKSYPVTLPEIRLKDLGTGPDGITAAELTQLALNAITTETLRAAEKFAKDFGKSATEAVTQSATNLLDKGLKDLLKRK